MMHSAIKLNDLAKDLSDAPFTGTLAIMQEMCCDFDDPLAKVIPAPTAATKLPHDTSINGKLGFFQLVLAIYCGNWNR